MCAIICRVTVELCSRAGNCSADGEECECFFYDGYKGAQCEDYECPGWPENCMGLTQGECNLATHGCTCEPGFGGKWNTLRFSCASKQIDIHWLCVSLIDVNM